MGSTPEGEGAHGKSGWRAGGGGAFWKIRRGICVVLSEIFTPIYTLFAILEEE